MQAVLAQLHWYHQIALLDKLPDGEAVHWYWVWVGWQVQLDVGGDDFFIVLLFYYLRLFTYL